MFSGMMKSITEIQASWFLQYLSVPSDHMLPERGEMSNSDSELGVTTTVELIRLLEAQDRSTNAEEVYAKFKKTAAEAYVPFVANVLIKVLLKLGRQTEAKIYLDQLPLITRRNELFLRSSKVTPWFL